MPDIASTVTFSSIPDHVQNVTMHNSKGHASFYSPSTLPRVRKKKSVKSTGVGDSSITYPPMQSRSFIRACQRAKRVRFFRNGDQYFKGIWYAIHPERFRSFDALLEDLTKSLDDLIYLPAGVRVIYTLDGLRKIFDLDELQHGASYVCSSNEYFKKIDYHNAKEPFWSYSTPKHSQFHENSLLISALSPSAEGRRESNDFIKPRIVTVIRNGVKPRKVVRLLLNKRTAHSFSQVLADINDLVKLDSGPVKRLFFLDGCQVSTCFFLFGYHTDALETVLLSRIFATGYYSSEIFMQNGIVPSKAAFASLSITVAWSIGSIIGILVIERVNRRNLYFISTAATLFCGALFVVFEALRRYLATEVGWIGWATVASIIGHGFAFTAGCGPISWFVTSEMVPQSERSLAQSIAITSYWLTGLVTDSVFYPFYNLIGSFAFLLVYSLPQFLCLLFLIKFMPETKGRETADIVGLLNRQKQASIIGRAYRKGQKVKFRILPDQPDLHTQL